MSQEQDVSDLLKEFKDYRKDVDNRYRSRNQSGGSQSGGQASSQASSFDKSTTKIVSAIGALNTTMIAASGATVDRRKEMLKFNEEVDKSTKLIGRLSATEERIAGVRRAGYQLQRDQNAAAAEAIRIAALSNEERKKEEAEKTKQKKQQAFEQGTAASAAARDRLSDARRQAESFDVIQESVSAFGGHTMAAALAGETLSKAFGSAVQGVEEYMGAVHKGQTGVAVATKATTGAMSALIDGVGIAAQVFTMLSPIGRVAKIAIMGLTEAVKWLADKFPKAVQASAEQLDAMYKSYGELSASGSALSGGLNSVRDSAHSLGFGLTQLDDFVKLVSSNSKEIKAFGGTVGEGTDKLSKVFQSVYNSGVGMEFEKMGIYMGEQRENALAYMTIVSRTGNILNMSVEQTRKGLIKFNKEIDEAAQLTGASREAAKQAELLNSADSRLQAAREDAIARRDDKELAKIDAIAKAASMLEAAGLKEAAKGARNYAAGGYAGGDAAVATANQFGLNKIRGDQSQAEIQQILANSSAQNAAMFRVLNKFTDKVDVMQITTRTEANQGVGLAARANADAAAKKNMTVDEYAKYNVENRVASAGDVGDIAKLKRTQLSTQINIDQALDIFSGTAKLMSEATADLAKSASELARVVGAKKSTWNNANYDPSASGAPAAPPKPPGAAGSFGSTGGGAATGMPLPTRGIGRSSGSGSSIDYSGLRIKSEESTGGGDANASLVQLARSIQDTIGGDLKHFTAFNDRYHQGLDRHSAHKTGTALDFTLNDPKKAAEISSIIRGMPGVKSVLNEYANLSKGGTGGHIHAEIKAMDGFDGVLSGPQSGYKPDLTMHGTERMTITPANSSTDDKLASLLTSMLEKQDSVIRLLEEGNGNGSKLVRSLA